MKILMQLLLLLSLAVVFSSCGKSGTISVKSPAYAAALTDMSSGFESAASYLLSTPPATFKFCVKKVRLEDENGEEQEGDGEGDKKDIEFGLGLIDVSAGVAKDWGSVANVPVNFKLSKIKIKVKKDDTQCAALNGKSLVYESYSTPEDIEFRWKFNPAVELQDGSVINVSMNSIIKALGDAGSNLSNGNIKSYIENIEGAATKE